MDARSAIAAVESRAFAARLTMTEVCEQAGIYLQVWSKAKTRGTISPKTLRRVETTLESIEKVRAQAPVANG